MLKENLMYTFDVENMNIKFKMYDRQVLELWKKNQSVRKEKQCILVRFFVAKYECYLFVTLQNARVR